MENKVTARNPITEGCIWKGMLLFALPIMLGSLLQQLYNTADAVIVGRALGKAALASVGGSSARITNLLVNAFVALSSGASVIVAQHFGARDTQRVRRSICTAMLLSVVCGILLTVLGITSARQLLVWMQTTPETLDASASYLRIFFLGMVPTMLYNMGSGILRAMGDSKRPLYYLFVCVVANIALDLLFVIVFQWGIEGAAAATALSQVVCAALVVRALRRLPEEQRLLYDREELDRGILRRMLRVGIPAALQSSMYGIANIVLQVGINMLGTDSMAGWTAFNKFDDYYWPISNAIGIAVMTYVGQNFGGRPRARARVDPQGAAHPPDDLRALLRHHLLGSLPDDAPLRRRRSDGHRHRRAGDGAHRSLLCALHARRGPLRHHARRRRRGGPRRHHDGLYLHRASHLPLGLRLLAQLQPHHCRHLPHLLGAHQHRLSPLL